MRNGISAEGLNRLPSQRRLLRLVIGFSIALITVCALSLFLVGQVASSEADDQAAETELRLFYNALKDRQSLMARDLMVVARWDDSVQAIALELDTEFITDDFFGTLWWDTGHARSFLVDGAGTLIASAREDRVDFTRRQLDPGSDLAIIARRAVEAHMRFRIPIDGGYGQKAMKSSEIGNVAVFSFAMIDGAPAVVSATAIVPDDEEVLLPEGPPPIAVVAKPIDAELLRDLNSQLDFADLAFSEATDGIAPIKTMSDKTLGSFSWSGAKPGSRIWEVVVPLAAMLIALLALAGLLVMRHLGRLSRALAETQSRIRDLALHDPLSGLANRLNFDQALSAAAGDVARKPFAAIACDLDRFKAVNDTHGHAAGDAVIKTVADRLRRTVGDQGLVERIGGDEFVILVTAFSDRHRLMLLATQVMSSVSAPIALDGGAVVDVGISLGISVAPDCGTNANAIMAAADRALYASKEGGRGRALFCADLQGADTATEAA